MIESESQRSAAVSRIQYWKASISAGEQSWLGQEQAQKRVMALHEQVDAYDKRMRRGEADLTSGDNQNSAGEAPAPEVIVTAPRGGVPCGSGSR